MVKFKPYLFYVKPGDLARITPTFEDRAIPVPVFIKSPVKEKINASKDTKLVKPGNLVMVIDEELLECHGYDEKGNMTDLSIKFVKALYCENKTVIQIWIWKDELNEVKILE